MLKHYLDLAPIVHKSLAIELRQVASGKRNGACSGLLGGQDELRGRRLAAAGLPHQAQGLAPVNGEAHPIDGLDPTSPSAQQRTADREVLLEATHFQQRLRHVWPPGGAAST